MNIIFWGVIRKMNLFWDYEEINGFFTGRGQLQKQTFSGRHLLFRMLQFQTYFEYAWWSRYFYLVRVKGGGG